MFYKNKTTGKSLRAILMTSSILTLTAIILFQSNTKAVAQTQQKGDGAVFTYVEQMPEFPGGVPALMTYLGNNIHYPPEAKKNNVEGKVVLQFVIKKDGAIGDIKIVKDLKDGCSEEAKRVVAAMPNWKPGMMKGEPVAVYYTLPVSFKLQSK